ncbi:uncharacterized protein CANTADRAFT_20004 [Suhomyces tanzawaensis NRRL Y-17324]|uniref:VLRF1 domain-containing protein n=1 Tax=Suhomyces tanzawaensis NRRL Y-17324 TaxID=984487 RepID=A0A1E4SSG2_9ASCO|nr:uncharacterized protein CANTADRAFT_20004 [Suhomyces tanzawaensis NRRL Y-17324]ODV82456.1 hypothetical protein CANTADRAFT_20004 [Suhomyces tanzawaensis NRRL Y-17324]
MSYDKEDLYIYTLHDKVKSTLELLYFDSLTQEEVPVATELSAANLATNNNGETKVDASKSEDSSYYKSDWYRFNLKRSLNGLPSLSEEAFEQLLESQSIESLSGSDTEEEDEEDVDVQNRKLESLIKKLELEKASDAEDDLKTVSHLNARSPFIFYKSSLLPENKAFGSYKGLYSEEQLLGSPLETLKSFSTESRASKSALFMIGGGHFAGAIVSHIPKNTRGNATNMKENRQEQAVNVIVSKTFHRYTTRRKQGGSQSASDNARGKANSAGSSIRRYNEQALIKEVRELLQEWNGHLKECASIFIRANGASNRKILVGYEGCVLTNDDKRIKTFPFSTKRATTSELKRAWVELSYLKVMDLPKVNEKAKKKLEKVEVKEEAQKPVERDPQEVANEQHSQELTSLLKKQKAPKLMTYIKQSKIDVDQFRLTPASKYVNYPTLLHYSSAHNLDHMVLVLMNNLKADPAIQNQFGRTPYEVTSDRDTKHSFQIARYKLGESHCDWSKTKIGPAKSKDQFIKEEEEEKERIKQEKQKLIQEELNKKTEMELRKPKISSSGSLNGGPSIASINELSGLSDQQKMRLMREQRARAAEARFKGMQGK